MSGGAISSTALLSHLPAGSAIGFTFQRFQNVVRGEEQLSGDREHDEKRPDLTFRTIQGLAETLDPTAFGLFVECKPISTKKKHSIPNYCKTLLARFLNGDYPWQMQEGLMIAYVFNGKTIDGDLARYLAKKTNARKFKVRKLPARLDPSDPNVQRSRQGRRVGTQKCDIEIDHLWLDAVYRARGGRVIEPACRGHLREFRTRLVADVMTGKLDVREAAAKLPVGAEAPEVEELADGLEDAADEAGEDAAEEIA